jgi:dipeptidyl aminopeptidase/acylaminoacyl peptidase
MPFGMTATGEFYYFRQSGLVDIFTVPLNGRGLPAGPPAFVDLNQRGDAMMPALWGDTSGRKLAFVMSQGPVLGIRDLASGAERRIETGLQYVRAPRWSADGNRILVRGDTDPPTTPLHLIDVSTGGRIPLRLPGDAPGGLGAQRLVPRPGPLQIVYAWTMEGGRGLLRRFTADTGEVEDILPIEPSRPLRAFEISPADGALALVTADATKASVLSVRDPSGATRELLRVNDPETIVSLAWVPDGRQILLVRMNSAMKQESLWSVSVDSGRAAAVDLRVPAMRELNVSPDGRMLAFTGGQALREVWVASNVLPPPATVARPGRAPR